MTRRILTLLFAASLASAVSGADEETVVRMFQLRHVSPLEASLAVEPILSSVGSLTLEPSQSRLTVRDTPDVMSRVVKIIHDLDRIPESYHIKVELLLGTSNPLPPQQQVSVDRRVRNMFKFESFRRLGVADFEGDIGSSAAAEIGEGYRIKFDVMSMGYSREAPWGSPDPGNRVHLRSVVLERAESRPDGSIAKEEILRTSIFLAPKQQVVIGAGRSEDSEDGLVLIVQAVNFGVR